MLMALKDSKCQFVYITMLAHIAVAFFVTGHNQHLGLVPGVSFQYPCHFAMTLRRLCVSLQSTRKTPQQASCAHRVLACTL